MADVSKKKVAISIRMDKNLKLRAKTFAKQDRRTLSNLIQMAVKEYLARRK